MRPMGVCDTILWRIFSGICFTISVAMKPGATALTRIWCLPNSLAHTLVIAMTKVWARELGKHQIRVNAVAPGFIATEMVKQMPEKILQSMVSHTPIGRMGQPEDIANAYVWLASDQASFITGTVLSVDGGVVTGT